MTPYEKEMFYELSKKFKKEKQAKELVSFKGQLKFLGILVVFLIFLLVISGIL